MDMSADRPIAMGQDAALRVFCETDYPDLAAYCYRLVGDEQLARDIAQEACVRLFGRWTRVREPRAYAFVLATNLARREWRRCQEERQAVDRLAGDEAFVELPDVGVRDIVSRLPRRWREVVVLRYYADLPVTEVARHLGLPEGTVKRRLGEARNLLARTLNGAV